MTSKQVRTNRTKVGRRIFRLLALLFQLGFAGNLYSQIETIPAGSFIVDMGIVPQTVGNALKPYGMIYDLINNYGVPIKWVIEPTKGKDGIDFTYNSRDFKGGPFIVTEPYRNATIDSRIAFWQTQGVVGITSTSPIDVPVAATLVVASIPRWTMDKQNGSIATGFFANAGIPPSAYGGIDKANWKLPSELTCCDDIFVMPHADPTWLTHRNLYDWNLDCRGAIWLGCHAGSALEDMFDNTTLDGDPVDYDEQTNFLAEKTGPATGSGPYSENALILWGNHSNGTPPYSYDNHNDPVMQFMGSLDAATLNGSEQIYIPKSAGWRPSTIIGVYDPDHPQRYSSNPEHRAVILAYGHGFGDEDRGHVMLEASHSINKALLPANIAAQRAFFNFSFLSGKTKAPDPDISLSLQTVFSGTDNTISFTLQGERELSEFTSILWESSCGGSFSPNNTVSTTFTAPVVASPTTCMITITLTDVCNRSYKSSTYIEVVCDLNISTTLVNPCFSSPASGSITMNITQATGPYHWTWSRTSPAGGPTSGTGLTIPDLGAGTYTVTVTANEGLGCSGIFSVILTQGSEIVPTATPVSVSCQGGSNGSINVSVSGGVPGYTYLWNDNVTTANRSGLTAGTYLLTVTDSKGCTATTSAVVTQPDAIVITPSITPVTCYANNNGIINLGVTGGTPGYTYLWNDGSALQNRTGLAPGSYSVTVTDNLGCTQTLPGMNITQPSAPLSLSSSQVNVLCNGNSNGSINLTASGGTPLPGGPPFYNYSWAGPGGFNSTSEDISGLAAGLYTVTVTDFNGCTATLALTITQPAAISLSTSVTEPTCPPTPPPTPPAPPATPPVNSDGIINLSVSGGNGPYSFVWSGSNGGIVPPAQVNNQNLNSLVSGTYTVYVTDSNPCPATTSVTLNYLNPNPVAPVSISH